jgi:diaminohydroxyphosphoribosylaminopyrimidine deaminase/5-amino-6-(5-phosphoribosylamino)uracil reductase
VLEAEAAVLNAGFTKRIRHGLPLVTLKLATTLDGRIATAAGESRWITGAAARRDAHAMRARHDAILIGSGTVLADDPDLTVRLLGATPRPPIRVIADARLRTPSAARLIATARTVPTILATAAHPPAALAPYREAGVEVIRVPAAPSGLSLRGVLGALAERGITRVLAEGGAGIAAALLREGLADRLAWFHAPAVMGGDGLPACQPLPVEVLAAMPRYQRIAARPLGPDWLTEFAKES